MNEQLVYDSTDQTSFAIASETDWFWSSKAKYSSPIKSFW